MTMTGNIDGVPWYRCAEATRLFDAWVTLVNAPRPDTFDAMLEYVHVSDAARDEYQAHVKACDVCTKRKESEDNG